MSVNYINKKWLRELAVIGLLAAITVLTLVFLAWNHWKVRQCKDIAMAVLNAPSALNVTVSSPSLPLYQKSFPFNRNGGFYILDRAIPPPASAYTSNAEITTADSALLPLFRSLEFTVNRQPMRRFVLYPFNGFHIIRFQNSYFVLTPTDRPIETLIKLNKILPELIKRLPSLEGIPLTPRRP